MWVRAVFTASKCLCENSVLLHRSCASSSTAIRGKNPPKIRNDALENTMDSPSTSTSNSLRIDDETEEDLDVLANKVLEALRKIDKEQVFVEPGMIKDPLNKLDVSQMETGEESASRPANRFREILYDEGELDNSDFTKPPSQENPHPFDPSTLPPTHARSLSAYVNHLPVLQRLIDLGMDLLEVELTSNIGRHLVRQNWQKDVQPKIYWLVKSVGVDPEEVGSYLTRNPFFLLQNLNEMKERIKYLHSKNFTKEAIAKIVVKNRYWLNNDVKIIDGRLGFIQRQFGLKGVEVRQLITKEPRIILFGIGPIQRLILLLNKELGFTPSHMKQMLLEDPRIFIADSSAITTVYNYLTKVMQLSIDQIAACPLALRCLVSDLRKRHEFLHRVKKAQYNENLPDYVSLEDILHPSDKYFAENVAKTYLDHYERFLKIL